MIALVRSGIVGEHEAGSLPRFASIGSYPLWYVVSPTRNYQDCSCWCPKCANTEEDEDLRVVAAEVNWEDPELRCEQCGERIESAYAEPEPVACAVPGCYLAVDEDGTCEEHGAPPASSAEPGT